jgi:MFS family permease
METGTERVASVWRNRNFVRLWSSDTISQFGTQFSGLAIPFTFVLLSKDPFLFGLLQSVGGLPFPLFALFVGVYVDRHYRKRIMTLANVGRGLALGSVPLVVIAGFLPSLGILLLFAVSFVVGLLTVFFDVSYQAILPSLVAREQLVQGNSMLEFSRSSAQVVGPAMAGLVVQAVYPPLTLAIDASSYLASAGVLSSIHTAEAVEDSKKTVWHDLREGLAVVLRDNRLRMIAGSTATFNLFGSALFPVAFLYLTGPLSLTAGIYGFIFAVGGVGLLVGVALSRMIVRIIGLGWAIVAAMLIGGFGLIPYYVVDPGLTNPALAMLGPIPVFGVLRIDRNVILLMIGQFFVSLSTVVYNINQVSLRQALVPLRLQGRMNASMRWIVWGTIPAGAAIGGYLGTLVGLKPAIEISVIGASFAFLWVLLSPVRSLKEIPERTD